MHKPSELGALQLEAMALAIPDFPKHPNRVPFSGVLTVLDSPSDRAPAGAAGHRVVLPRPVAEAALPSLLGMAVDYAPGLRGHDVRRKIGVITGAEIRERKLEIAGYLFGKDFPDVVRELRARRETLGMSYEVTGVRVADPSAEIWVLEHVVFTGAAILERAVAAYQTTSLAASRETRAAETEKGVTMDQKIIETLEVLASASQQLASECASLRAAVDEMRHAQESVSQSLQRSGTSPVPAGIEARVEELRRQNETLRVQAELFSAQVTRKTIPPQVLTLLAKSGVGSYAVGANGRVELPVLDKALEGLPVEQRIAVKSQLARAGALD
jgi:hypothetical protein